MEPTVLARRFLDVTLPDTVAAAIVAHARRAAPHECCGLLLASGSRIVEAVPARNISTTPLSTYTIEPGDHFHAIRSARDRTLDVVGAYHSHPRSLARPSATDRALAFSDFLFVIVGLAARDAEIAAWELVSGNFVPVPLVRTP